MARAGRHRPHRAVRLSRLRRSSALRWPLLVLAFLALGIQSLSVQPHIHAQPSETGFSLDISDGDDGSVGEIPIEQAQTDCPACQSEQQQRQFLRPSDATFALPAFINYRGIEITELPTADNAASHSWQGRAPPQA